MTRRFASSGGSRFTGSSRSNSPSRTKASVAVAVIGFVVDAIRNNEPRSTGLPADRERPIASTCTSSPCATGATSPGTCDRRRARPRLRRTGPQPVLVQSHVHSSRPTVAANLGRIECGQLISPARDSSDSTPTNMAPSAMDDHHITQICVISDINVVSVLCRPMLRSPSPTTRAACTPGAMALRRWWVGSSATCRCAIPGSRRSRRRPTPCWPVEARSPAP